MARLLREPAVVDMRFVTPRVKKGDFYLMKSPISGRNHYVYPRMMGETRYAVTERLGDDDIPEGAQSFFSALFSAPQRIAAGVQETQERVRRTEQLMKLTLAASLVASGLIIWKTLKE